MPAQQHVAAAIVVEVAGRHEAPDGLRLEPEVALDGHVVNESVVAPGVAVEVAQQEIVVPVAIEIGRGGILADERRQRHEGELPQPEHQGEAGELS